MAGLISNFESIIDLNTLFDNLDITFDDTSTISDGDSTYNLFAISNLDNEKKEILTGIGFGEIKDGIFVINKDEIEIRTVLEQLLPYYRQKETEQWHEIINKIVVINERTNLFKSTSKQLIITLRWNGKLVENEDDFKSLILDVWILLKESSKGKDTEIISENCRSHEFWKGIGDLRNNYCAHDPAQWGENSREHYKKIHQILDNLFPSSQTKKSQLDCIIAQSRLFASCLDFLNTVLSETS